MRLERIKLVGFKSFVDPTTVEFPTCLTGIVGPNGCGKSNTIDAVRWVMGESSAKNLRGESGTDVIFNGSVERKPIGQASVELVFDNSEGKLGGEYAKFGQISIKRQVNRDAQSTYFLNGSRCRRRDIQDVFLGTGMGPRSYSIIEQGMISKLIEAKPEEFRAHLEEVSGISKYKERRRETENRIRHTRENLDRLNDLQEELDKQVAHLKRQASAAERFKVLKEEERTLHSQELALRWTEFNEQSEAISGKLEGEETALQAKQADLQRVETQITELREEQHELLDTHNKVQSRYYSLGAEVSRAEQEIHHYKERQSQLQLDLQQAESSWQSVKEHQESDQARLTELKAEREILLPQLEENRERAESLKERVSAAEDVVNEWQLAWDDFNKKAAESSQTAQVEQTRIQHIEKGQQEVNRRLSSISQEQEQLKQRNPQAELDQFQQEMLAATAEVTRLESAVEQILTEIKNKRELRQHLSTQLDKLRGDLQTAKGRLASLEALQQEALGKKDRKAADWLSANQLDNASRLAELLKVDAGWEQAVEQVLGNYLESVCLDDFKQVAKQLEELDGCALTLFSPNSAAATQSSQSFSKLSDKVTGSTAVQSLLSNVYTAESLPEGLQIAEQLAAHESVICKTGEWLGKSWVKIAKNADVKAGLILREQEIKSYQDQIASLQAEVEAREEALEACITEFADLEQGREEHQKQLNQARAVCVDIKAKISVKQSQVEQQKNRLKRLEDEAFELQQKLTGTASDLDQARSSWQDAMASMEVDANKREELLSQRDGNREQLDIAQREMRELNERLHQQEIKAQTVQSQIAGLEQNLVRIDEQRETLQARCEQLQESLAQGDSPVEAMQEKLKEALEQRVKVEAELTTAKQALDASEHQSREAESQRHNHDRAIQDLRTRLEGKRMKVQEVKVRCDTLLEQLTELGYELKAVLENIPEDLDKEAVSEQLTRTTNRIQRLGPINLAAIDELEVKTERKEYLDKQTADVEKALQTLENAILKIDKETRSRFKETFDSVNESFQEYFPKVFGGGSAKLELTGDDLLTTGVQVIARPPGKKNSTIHLLSGGEKALTAISLVFSMFQLNPAPFCMLDEVDAPLDDANVGRYANLVREIAQKVQIIFISHNKVAIEMAKQLVGVTMHEPGVSRIVSVDIDEAVALVEEA
jgi:chromosome segregation protein